MEPNAVQVYCNVDDLYPMDVTKDDSEAEAEVIGKSGRVTALTLLTVDES